MPDIYSELWLRCSLSAFPIGAGVLGKKSQDPLTLSKVSFLNIKHTTAPICSFSSAAYLYSNLADIFNGTVIHCSVSITC